MTPHVQSWTQDLYLKLPFISGTNEYQERLEGKIRKLGQVQGLVKFNQVRSGQAMLGQVMLVNFSLGWVILG